MGRLGFPIFLLLATFVSAQTGGAVSVASGSGSPGSVVSLPVTLTLNTGLSIATLSFGVKVLGNGAAPALSTGVTFTSIAPTPTPSFTANDANAVGPFFQFDPAISGSRTLGLVSFTIPAGAVAGQSYTVQIPLPPNATNATNTVSIQLAVGPSTTVSVGGSPALNRRGLVNGASFSQAAVVSPGSIVSLFGISLAPGIEAAVTLPLPTSLLGVQVLVNGTAAPLFFVSPSQINFQMLSGITDPTIQVVVVSTGVRSLPLDVPLVAEEPGLFTISADGAGQAAALNGDNSANRSGNPAAPGSVLQIFATGLGKVDPPVSPGQPAPADPLSLTLAKPVVRIGGAVAELLFSGLAPGFVGLNQINVRIPQGLAPGQQNLQVELNGRQSNVATVAIR